MSDLEKFAEQLGRDSLIEKLMTKERVLPCAYGGGDCIMSYPKVCLRENEETKRITQYEIAYCIRAAQIKWKFLEIKSSHARRLKQAGCPNTKYGFLEWDCKYADGKSHFF